MVGHIKALSAGGGSFLIERKLPEIVVPEQKIKTSKIEQTSGGYLNINYDNWRHMYTDECTGQIIPEQFGPCSYDRRVRVLQ